MFGRNWMLLDDENIFVGARSRSRTGTPIRREILSLLCLPISPPGRIVGLHQIAVRILSPYLEFF